MASIPSNGYAAVMAGTNVYTGSNFFGSDCPKTPIVPTDPDDLCNRAFVLGAIPPPPPTPPVTEFSYTNTSNAVVPVNLPTAAGQKLNLLASGDAGGAWSSVTLGGISPFGETTAFHIGGAGEWWLAIKIGLQAYVLRYSAGGGTLLGVVSVYYTTGAQARVNSIIDRGIQGLFIGGEFDTAATASGGAPVNAYNIAYFPSPVTPFSAPTAIGSTAQNIFGVNGIVNSITLVDTVGFGSTALVAGGIFNATLPSALGTPVSNLIVILDIFATPLTQTFSTCGGAFRVDGGGGVNVVLGDGLSSGSSVFIGGSFSTVGSSFTVQPSFARLDVISGGSYGILIPAMNGSVQAMCFSTRTTVVGVNVILLGGLFDLSAFGGSNGTAYFTVSTGVVSPAVAFPPAVGAFALQSVSGTDAILFGSGILMWNDVIGSNYWNNEGASGNLGVPLAIQFVSFPINNFFTAGSGDNGYVRKFTASTSPAVATFQLPSARFRSATDPNNQYQNAVFSTAAGAQVFLSGTELYWSPAGALTTGLTFS
jgi:hypothetical protein